MALKILHWNADGLRSKVSLLKALLSEQDIDICLIFETCLREVDSLKVPNYCVIRKDELSERGIAYRELVALVKRRIVHQPFVYHKGALLNSLGLELSVGGQSMRVYGAYHPPGGKLIVADVNRHFESSLPTIVCGDLNSKHLEWCASRICPNGRRLEDDAERCGYNVQGPEVPTCYPESSAHEPDVLEIIVHKNLNCDPSQEVLAEYIFSDHLPVLVVVLLVPVKATPPISKPLVDWGVYTSVVDFKIARSQSIQLTM